LILVFGTFSCSVPTQFVSPIYRSGKTYKIGEVQRANLGSPMLSIYSLYEFPAYKPKYEFQPPDLGLYKAPPLKPNQRWVLAYVSKGNYIVESKEYSPWVGIEIKPNGEIASKHPWINLRPTPPLRVIQSAWKLPEPQLFIETVGHIEVGSFKAELLYNGISGSTILMSYREYVDRMDRPAFQQELRYDLNQSDEITFRSLRMKILKTTNKEIIFQVFDDGGLPWVSRP